MLVPTQQLIDDSIARARSGEKHKEQTTWHASSLGSCMRGVFLARLGLEQEPVDARTLRVFNMGFKIEDWVMDLIEAQPEVKLTRQVPARHEGLNLSGYADAVIEYNGGEHVYEVKSRHSKSFWYMIQKGEGASENHLMQLWAYLHALKVNQGTIVYVSKDDLTIAEYFVSHNNQELAEKTLGYLGTLNNAWSNMTLPPLAAPTTWQAKYCHCHKVCKALEKGDITLEQVIEKIQEDKRIREGRLL